MCGVSGASRACTSTRGRNQLGEAFVPEAAVEAFDVVVINGLAWLNGRELRGRTLLCPFDSKPLTRI